MIQFSDAAKKKVVEYIEGQKKDGLVLRIAVTGKSGGTYTYAFGLDEEKNTKPTDVTMNIGGFKTVFDAESAKKLQGATIDWIESVSGAGFNIENPNQPASTWSDPIAQKIQELLDNEINPAVATHGGFVELVDVQGKKVLLRLAGGCHGCGMANVTLRQGIELKIKEALPEVEEIIDVTDHASGENPYYAPEHK
ncbi:MAG TPA: iron-sulfur cluster assembly accessory protein [Bdellovibrionota bacterium]|nr:iron-sulfur cluster assembly accessory protein [Bdellovibrionota bacterium]